MHASTQPTIRKKGFVSYSSKFFTESTIALFTALSYCIIDGIIYGFQFKRYSSMLLLCSAAFVTAAPILIISYVVFKCCNKEGNSLKEAVKISNLKAISISGKMFAATLVIVSTFLVHTLITNAISGQDIPFLSLVRKIFGFNRSGAWIGGNGGLLLCFMVSSFVVFAISNLMYHYSKDKKKFPSIDEIKQGYEKGKYTAKEVFELVSQHNEEISKRRDKILQPTLAQNDNHNRSSVTSSADNPNALYRGKATEKTVTRAQVEGNSDNIDSDNELQAANAKCTKSTIEVNSMLKKNNIEDIQKVRPIPRPRKGSSQQENLVSQPISNVTVTSMTGASNKDAKKACQGVNVQMMVGNYTSSLQDQPPVR